MPDRDRPHGDEMFTSHPDLIEARWAKTSRRAKWRHIRRVRRPRLGAPTRRLPPGRVQSITWVVIVVAILGALPFIAHRWPLPRGAVPLRMDPPTTTATDRESTPLDLNQPFANTPAAGWSDGADGIQPPRAVPLGGYSAAQVADAEERVKKALIAAHLDDQMLVNHDGSAYLALLAPKVQAGMGKDLTDLAGGPITMLAPDFSLLPAPIKVNGTMAVGTDSQGNLLVHTNYVFAYPFAPSDPSTIFLSWQIVAIHHVSQDFEFITGSGYAAANQGLWPGESQSYFANIACHASLQGLLAPAYSEHVFNPMPDNEDPDALYDPNHPMDISGTCRN